MNHLERVFLNPGVSPVFPSSQSLIFAVNSKPQTTDNCPKRETSAWGIECILEPVLRRQLCSFSSWSTRRLSHTDVCEWKWGKHRILRITNRRPATSSSGKPIATRTSWFSSFFLFFWDRFLCTLMLYGHTLSPALLFRPLTFHLLVMFTLEFVLMLQGGMSQVTRMYIKNIFVLLWWCSMNIFFPNCR